MENPTILITFFKLFEFLNEYHLSATENKIEFAKKIVEYIQKIKANDFVKQESILKALGCLFLQLNKNTEFRYTIAVIKYPQFFIPNTDSLERYYFVPFHEEEWIEFTPKPCDLKDSVLVGQFFSIQAEGNKLPKLATSNFSLTVNGSTPQHFISEGEQIFLISNSLTSSPIRIQFLYKTNYFFTWLVIRSFKVSSQFSGVVEGTNELIPIGNVFFAPGQVSPSTGKEYKISDLKFFKNAVIIPGIVNKKVVKQSFSNKKIITQQNSVNDLSTSQNQIQESSSNLNLQHQNQIKTPNTPNTPQIAEPPKRKRGRPRKTDKVEVKPPINQIPQNPVINQQRNVMQETKNIITQPPIQMKQEIPPTSRIEPQVPQGPPVSRVEPVAKANVMQIEEPKPMVTPDMWSCLYFVAPVNRFYMSIPLDDEYESFWENQCNEYDCL